MQIQSRNPEVAQTSQLFPKIMAIIIFVCSISIIIKELLKDSEVMEKIDWKVEARTLLLIGIYVIYFILLKYTGFIISSVVFVILITLHSKEKKRVVYGINLSAVLAVYFIFELLLKKNLP